MSSPRERPDGSSSEVPRPGEILAKKYRVLEGLGAGGMGVVLLVEHMELGQRMAVKMMRPGGMHDAGAVTRFLREARAAAGLESEHVVRIFDVGTLESGVPYMVMELLRGEDLSRVLQANGRLLISEAVDYVLQACHAIAEAHGLGIVHRDLKPSNLFLTRRSDGSALIKVLDFGISKALADANPDEAPTSLTSTSTVMGSPLYMSPEQIRNSRQVDGRTDIWSLGVILHELLTGAPAFQADTVPGICAAIAADEPAYLSSLRDDVPPELETVVVRCLEKNITQRFQSVSELMNALRGFAPANYSSSPPLSALASTLPEVGSSPGGLPAPPVRSHGGRVVMSASDRPPFRSSRPSGRPESHKGAIASGGAVAISAETHPSVTRPPPRFRLAFFVGAVVVGAVAAGWTLASLRHEGRESAPSEASPASLDRLEEPASFVLIVDSEPPGAAVLEGSQKIGTTPVHISVENESARGNPRKLSIERPGFLPYSIVQGPSGHDVHVFAALEPSAQEPPPSARLSAPPMSHHAKPLKPTVAAAVSSAEPPPVSATPAPPATPDIRLQR